MFGVLATLFIVIPLIEAYLLVTVGGMIGAGPTVAIMLLTGILGAALARREGLRAVRRVQEAMAQGQLPGKELMSGAMVLAGGILLLTPGFLTDVLGFVCLFPLTREPLRHLLWLAVSRYAEVKVAEGHTGPVVIDVEGRPTDEERARGWDIGRTRIEVGAPRDPEDYH